MATGYFPSRPSPKGPVGLAAVDRAVDRANVSIIVYPIERGSSFKDYGRLAFLLSGLRSDCPQAIEKTIVYIDSPNKMYAARYYLMQLAIRLGMSRDEVSRVIRLYFKDIRPGDWELLYNNFLADDSPCRILLAPFALDMDIRNVKRVVQFGPPSSGDLADLMQRFGCAVRDGTTQGKAYFFVPHWYIDIMGTSEVAPEQHPVYKPSALRYHDYASDSSASRYSIFTRLDVESDASSDSDSDPTEGQSSGDPELGQFGGCCPLKWTKVEVSRREKLRLEYPGIYGFVNAKCFRKEALKYLQQRTGEGVERAVYVPPKTCCNSCNHSLGRLPKAPPRPPVAKPPRKGTIQGFAWEEIDRFCDAYAEKKYRGLFITNMPGSVVLPPKGQWKIAEFFTPEASVEEIKGRIEAALSQLDYDEREDFVAKLCAAVPNIYSEAFKRLQNQRKVTKRKRTS
ncbi:hypothetical protein GGR54DRAFT_2162 [Hypoxylon sp. NC1633]|nr:hypothetical protein GGR54DRAFT_2162 [Hypoxylon sp. NC1633]